MIPTALQYLRKYGGNQVDLGPCISAYSFASLFSSPLMGKLSDKLSINSIYIETIFYDLNKVLFFEELGMLKQ